MRRFLKGLKWVILAAAVTIISLGGVLWYHTAQFTSRQIQVEPIEAIEIDESAAADRLSRALTFETISHQDPAQFDAEAFEDLHAFLEASYPAVHERLEHEKVADYSLLYHWPGSDESARPILLMSHLDVVPVEPGTEPDWVHPPFSGEISEGFIWGRGTLDDKGGVLGILEAVEYLIGQGFEPTRPIYLAFGHDEEIGGAGNAQIALLLRGRGVRFEYVLDEGSAIVDGVIDGVTQPVALVSLAEKGYTSVELTVEHQGGHSSMPPPQTAVGIIAAAVHKLETHPFSAELREPASLMLDYLGPEMPPTQRVALANRWLTAPAVAWKFAANPTTNASVRTTTAATIIGGGIKDNVLPTKARAVVNFRILPGDSVDGVLEHVQRVVDDKRVHVSHDSGQSSEPSRVSSIESPAFETLHRTIREVFPDVLVSPALTVGATDSRHYEGIADDVYRFIPMRMYPDDLSRFHGTNERIGIDNYAEIIRFYVQLLRNSAG